MFSNKGGAVTLKFSAQAGFTRPGQHPQCCYQKTGRKASPDESEKRTPDHNKWR